MVAPEEHLWRATREMSGVRAIFQHLQSLSYDDTPNYALVQEQLKNILLPELNREKSLINQILQQAP